MLHRTLKILAIVLAAIVCLIVAGTVIPRPLVDGRAVSPDKTRHTVFVLSSPIHTDLAIPVDAALLAEFGFLREAGVPVALPAVRYIVFGWGGRAFYTETPTWADLKPMPLFKGLTIDASVMHVDLAGDIVANGRNAVAVGIGDDGLARLAGFIRASFADGPEGPIALPGTAYGETDAFFEARGAFTAVAGCNTWTAAALREAGVATGFWTPLPWLLTQSLHLHNDPAVLTPPL